MPVMHSCVEIPRTPVEDGLPSPLKVALDKDGRVMGVLNDSENEVLANPQLSFWMQQVVDLCKRGALAPSQELMLLAEEARDPAHPLHHEFEWDDTKAAASTRESFRKRLASVGNP